MAATMPSQPPTPSIPFPRSHSHSHSTPFRPEYYTSLAPGDHAAAAAAAAAPPPFTASQIVGAPTFGHPARRVPQRSLTAIGPPAGGVPMRQDAFRREKERARERANSTGSANGRVPVGDRLASPKRQRPSDLSPLRTQGAGMAGGGGAGTSSAVMNSESRRGSTAGLLGGGAKEEPPTSNDADGKHFYFPSYSSQPALSAIVSSGLSLYDTIEGRLSAGVANVAAVGGVGRGRGKSEVDRPASPVGHQPVERRGSDRAFRHSFQALGNDSLALSRTRSAGAEAGYMADGGGSGNNSGTSTPVEYRRARVRSNDPYISGAGNNSPNRNLRPPTSQRPFPSSASSSDNEVEWPRTALAPSTGTSANPFSPYHSNNGNRMGDNPARRSFDALSRTLDYDNARRHDDYDDDSPSGRRSSVSGLDNGPFRPDGFTPVQTPSHQRDALLTIPSFSPSNMTRSRTADSLSSTAGPRTAPITSNMASPLSRMPTSKSARDVSLSSQMGRGGDDSDRDRSGLRVEAGPRSRGMSLARSGSLGTAAGGEVQRREMVLEAKCVLLGSTGAGKTSLGKRHTDGTFVPTSATINSSLFTSKSVHQGVEVRLQLWDTAGEERHRSLTKLYYRGAHAALVVYDISDAKSFADVQGWLRELRSSFPEGQEPLIFVIGSKSDLPKDKRQVDRRFAREQVASWLGISPVPERSPHGDSSFTSSAIDHDLKGRAGRPPIMVIEPPTSPAPNRSQKSSMSRSATTGTLATIAREPDSESFKGAAPRQAAPFRLLSMLSSASSTKPPSEASNTRPPSVAPPATRRQITGARAQSVSGATALMVMSPPKSSASDRFPGSVSVSGLNGMLLGTSPPPPRDRRKSEDWSGSRMKADPAAAVLQVTPSLGQPMPTDPRANRKSLELLSPGLPERSARQEIRIQEPEGDDLWGRWIPGTNVRVGEVSSKTGKGVQDLFLTINSQLVLRRERITRERLRRERESVFLQDEGNSQDDGSSRGNAKASSGCCAI